MDWKIYPVITIIKEGGQEREVIQDQLINLNDMGYFRKWVDGDKDRSVGYSSSGKKHLIDIPFKQLEDELISNRT